MTLHQKLIELSNRLSGDDAVTVLSAAFALAPLPTPKIETLTQPIPGYYHHLKVY